MRSKHARCRQGVSHFQLNVHSKVQSHVDGVQSTLSSYGQGVIARWSCVRIRCSLVDDSWSWLDQRYVFTCAWRTWTNKTVFSVRDDVTLFIVGSIMGFTLEMRKEHDS